MKNIIVISTSLRHGSNSDMLAEKFLEGALSAGNSVERFLLSARISSSAGGAWLARGWGVALSRTT